MRNLEVKIRPLAEIDIEEIWHSIALYNIIAAENFSDKLKQKIQLLCAFPEHGPLRPDIFPNARISIEGQYLIIYRFEKDVVEVIRVVHGARDLNELDIF